MGLIFFVQVSCTNGNISKLPSLALFFQIATFFLIPTSLSDEVRMFSSLPCMLVLRLLRRANISAKYSSLESQNSHWRYPQMRSCFSVLKTVCSSLCIPCTRHSTFPLESHLASVCRAESPYQHKFSQINETSLVLFYEINYFNNLL